ncbi:hypothetical protein [Microbulbifer taiwanensis]|uniref:Uncharacterized protein n=1 Tax=Microbulbifer taiwanensis TaxID=986746 RepID=A0ABW1YG64_9GAMM|nr:hypothetical protein [Microbulbifer taiwanensis]
MNHDELDKFRAENPELAEAIRGIGIATERTRLIQGAAAAASPAEKLDIYRQLTNTEKDLPYGH